ncbi:uncharacterized protein Z520_06845 [Fonsecaea multimorphosa CBS 102226]|uniref:Uncharacterized protein n=1 Tax=Fonsecaea multimorphosa CBS 102226 TaxID=1442371 RepID=A0A0D2KLB1_9EURO|nr:uncharacterized protein Z520_06845 [Fonsecaea multimorphosa CBS 102226]KIX97393.1 hypothetical protein Z520_06845 [Fonsecaea multimorphosa CBS 102226]OAL23361.1 hypothetical protein AYO22_06411 [Fonsecaea multimorphosa]
MFRSVLTAGAGALTTVPAFFLWTRNCSIADLPTTDELFRNTSFAKYNPTPSPGAEMRDVCVRRYPLSQIRPELVEDARRGGTAMIEAFNQGIWGGFEMAPPPALRHFARNPVAALVEAGSAAEHVGVGTAFTDHLVVLDKTPQSVLLRGGKSPLTRPDMPRDMDGLLEIQVVPDFDKGHVDFIFKSVFFAGTGIDRGEGSSEVKIVPEPLVWAHKQYTKLLVESGVLHVKNQAWFA